MMLAEVPDLQVPEGDMKTSNMSLMKTYFRATEFMEIQLFVVLA